MIAILISSWIVTGLFGAGWFAIWLTHNYPYVPIWSMIWRSLVMLLLGPIPMLIRGITWLRLRTRGLHPDPWVGLNRKRPKEEETQEEETQEKKGDNHAD